jgi:hypothetical protein
MERARRREFVSRRIESHAFGGVGVFYDNHRDCVCCVNLRIVVLKIKSTPQN